MRFLGAYGGPRQPCPFMNALRTQASLPTHWERPAGCTARHLNLGSTVADGSTASGICHLAFLNLDLPPYLPPCLHAALTPLPHLTHHACCACMQAPPSHHHRLLAKMDPAHRRAALATRLSGALADALAVSRDAWDLLRPTLREPAHHGGGGHPALPLAMGQLQWPRDKASRLTAEAEKALRELSQEDGTSSELQEAETLCKQVRKQRMLLLLLRPAASPPVHFYITAAIVIKDYCP